MSGTAKEISRLLKEATKAGATVTLTKGGHYKVQGDGWSVFVSQSPRSVGNCVRNARRDMRKRGLNV